MVVPCAPPHWTIGVTGDPDLSHATRRDNPHQTTAEQVGAYTKAAVDDAINAAVGAEVSQRNAAIGAAVTGLVGSAPATLNTLNELAAALGSDPNFATTMTSQLASRVRWDEPQVLSAVAKAQVGQNIGGTGPNQVVALDVMGRLPGINAEAVSGVAKIPQGRLSLQQGMPWPTGVYTYVNQQVFYVPYNGCHVPIYESSAGGLRMIKFTASDADMIGMWLSINDAYYPAYCVFDVFAAYVSGTVRLGTGPMWGPGPTSWGNFERAPSGALAKYQGLEVNAQAMAFRYGPGAGEIQTCPAGQATWLGTFMVSESPGWIRLDNFRYDNVGFPAYRTLWNRHNRVTRTTGWTDPSSSWAFQSSWAPNNVAASAAPYIYFVTGEPGTSFRAHFWQYSTPPNGSGNVVIIGIGLNTTSGPSGSYAYGWPTLSETLHSYLEQATVGAGAHYLCAVMYCIQGIAQVYGTYPNCGFTLTYES